MPWSRRHGRFSLKKATRKPPHPRLSWRRRSRAARCITILLTRRTLFRCVVTQEAQAVAARIEQETEQPNSALDAVVTGGEAYFAAMAVAGRARLLLVDGPAVLGHAEMNQHR